METGISELGILARVSLSALLGAVVGLEREIVRKPAGVRTHMLVCAGATLLVLLGEALVREWAAGPFAEVVRPDPTRVLHGILVGIGFLGAGTIVNTRPGGQVEGLTTAASIWLVTAIGIAVAASLTVVAVGVTGLAVTVIVGVGWIERRFGLQEHASRDTPRD